MEGSIQRFETAVELFWKTLGRALEYEGFEERTPRHCVKEAFKLGWLDDENAWLEILDRRNITTHEYLSSELVMDYYRTIKDLAPEIRKAFDKLRERYASLPGDAD